MPQNAGVPGIGLSGSGAGSFSGDDREPTAARSSATCRRATTRSRCRASPPGSSTGTATRRGPARPASWRRARTRSCSSTTTPGRSRSPSRPGPAPGPPRSRPSADSVVVFNTGMTTPRVFGTPGTQRDHDHGAPRCSPSPRDYAVYAGTCEGDNPNPADDDPAAGPAGGRERPRPAGRDASPRRIQLPALYLTVTSGTSSSNPGSPVVGRHREDRRPELPERPHAGVQAHLHHQRRRASSPTPGCPTAPTTSASATRPSARR